MQKFNTMKKFLFTSTLALALVSLSLFQSCRKDDTQAPVISIIGNNPMTVYLGTAFNDPGATATDNEDGTVSVSVLGSVDATTAHSYVLTYSAIDDAGNSSAANRVVKVVMTRSNYIWSGYQAADTCTTNSTIGPFAYPGNIAVGSGTDSVIISQFRGLGNCYATVNANVIVIPLQTIGTITVSGSGTMNNKANKLTLNYSDGTDNFTAVLTKQ